MSNAISTSEVLDRHRSGVWADAIATSFVPLQVTFDDPSSFAGSLDTEQIGNLDVAIVRATPHLVRRTPTLVDRGDAGYYKLGMPMHGTVTIRQDGREAVVPAGDLVFFDTTRPYRLVDETGEMLVLMFSHDLLGLPAAQIQRLTARRLSGRTGIGLLVTPLLHSLADNFQALAALHSQRVADHILDLVTTLLADELAADGFAPEDNAGLLRSQVHAFIEANLTDPWLSPDTIAAGCHISTGYLHRIFRAEGTTVSKLIRGRRLELCRKRLLDPVHASEAVGAIGAQFGFYDAGHFSRVFKAEFGQSPRDYRATHLRPRRIPEAALILAPR